MAGVAGARQSDRASCDDYLWKGGKGPTVQAAAGDTALLFLGHLALCYHNQGPTFCMSTLLSPSAVMPACAKPRMAPNLFTLR